MSKMNKTKKNALWIIGATWYVMVNIFLATFIRLNYLPEAYEGAYWLAVGVYCVGVYFAVCYYLLMGGHDE